MYKTHLGEYVFDNGWKLAGYYLVSNLILSLMFQGLAAMIRKNTERIVQERG